LSFPSISGTETELGVNLKSVIPAESEEILTKAIGATSTELFNRVKKDTTKNTVKTTI
jgi:hypothetical protein